MGALFLDLTHKLYVWRVYLTLRADLADVLGLLGADRRLRRAARSRRSIRLPEVLAVARRARCRSLRGCPTASLAQPGASCARSAGATSCSASALGIYTGILLNTMVARPLWNSAILGPLFLFSGLSAGAAMVHLAERVVPGPPRAAGHRSAARSPRCGSRSGADAAASEHAPTRWFAPTSPSSRSSWC